MKFLLGIFQKVSGLGHTIPIDNHFNVVHRDRAEAQAIEVHFLLEVPLFSMLVDDVNLRHIQKFFRQ